jgi:RecJ-like exonuclease
MGAWVFTHGDVDGICAGAVALAAAPGASVFFTHPYGLAEDLASVKEGDTVILCDIALPEDRLSEVLDLLSLLAERGSLTYIDHHPLPEGVSKEKLPGRVAHSLEASSSELAYLLLNPGKMHSRVAVYGAVGDFLEGTPHIQRLLEIWDRRTLYFEAGILVQAVDGQKRNYELKRALVSSLASGKPPSSDRQLVEAAVRQTQREDEAIKELGGCVRVTGRIAYTLNFPFSLGKAAVYARGLTDALVGLAGEDWKGMVDMSLRTRSPRVDLNRMLRNIAPRLGGSGGGHREAAGARVPRENFGRFLEELNLCLDRYYADG